MTATFEIPTVEPVIDLIADAIEVTQAVQDLRNSVRLVQDKRTFVRFHVHASDGGHWTYAQLRVRRGGMEATLNPVRGSIWVWPAPNRRFMDQAFLFELPSAFRQGTVTISAYLNPITPWRTRDPLEVTYTNNDRTTTVTFEPAPRLHVILYNVSYRLGGTTHQASSGHAGQMLNWMGRAYPISSAHLWYRTLSYGNGLASGGNLVRPSCGDVNSLLAAARTWDVAHNNTLSAGSRYYGMVTDSGGFMRGCAAGIPAFVASGPTGTNTWGWDDDGSYGDWYGAHELGHDYGRGHANFCGAGAGPAYPYPAGRISPFQTGTNALFGFDIERIRIYGPDWYDLMTYCTHLWVSDFTYEGLLSYFQSNPVQASQQLPSAQLDRLLISGVLDPATGTVDLQPIFTIPDAEEIKERIPGDYAILIKDRQGNELARYPFTPIPLEDSPQMPFGPPWNQPTREELILELVPAVAGTAAVEIEGPGGGVLKRVTAGGAAPAVTLLAPNGGETLSGEMIAVAWQAADADGDPLTFNVDYSSDNGATWVVVAQNVAADTTEVPRANLKAGTAARFRVWATDGINTASDASDAAFTLLNRPPEVTIVSPAAAITTVLDQPVNLQATAYDVDTGSMADAQVSWRSDRDGWLGDGTQLTVSDLSLGEHAITVQADDGAGGVASDSTRITVVTDPTQAPPLPAALVVDPPALALRPATGITQAAFYITNQAGARPIAWEAQPDQAWLRISPDRGTTPAEVTVSLAAGLPPGLHAASIRLTSADLPGQSATVAVTAEGAPLSLYLPLIIAGEANKPLPPSFRRP